MSKEFFEWRANQYVAHYQNNRLVSLIPPESIEAYGKKYPRIFSDLELPVPEGIFSILRAGAASGDVFENESSRALVLDDFAGFEFGNAAIGMVVQGSVSGYLPVKIGGVMYGMPIYREDEGGF